MHPSSELSKAGSGAGSNASAGVGLSVDTSLSPQSSAQEVNRRPDRPLRPFSPLPKHATTKSLPRPRSRLHQHHPLCRTLYSLICVLCKAPLSPAASVDRSVAFQIRFHQTYMDQFLVITPPPLLPTLILTRARSRHLPVCSTGTRVSGLSKPPVPSYSGGGFIAGGSVPPPLGSLEKPMSARSAGLGSVSEEGDPRELGSGYFSTDSSVMDQDDAATR